jgi:hypothetical protein
VLIGLHVLPGDAVNRVLSLRLRKNLGPALDKSGFGHRFRRYLEVRGRRRSSWRIPVALFLMCFNCQSLFWSATLVLACLQPVFSHGERSEILIPMDSSWHYNSAGTNLPTEWITRQYDDSAWPLGGALLGYDRDELYLEPVKTELNLTALDSTNAVTRYYFRTRFEAPADRTGLRLIAGVLVDDGAIFYCNGVEVRRINIGSASFEASRQLFETYYQVIEFPAEVLVEGENVIAVEVRQSFEGSNDVMFGMQLVAVWTDPVAITNGPTIEGGALQTATTIRVGVHGTDPRFQWFRGAALISGATNQTYTIPNTSSSHAGEYTVSISNALNKVTGSVTLQPPPDVPPVVRYAVPSGIDSNAIEVGFSEALDRRSATNVANYSLAREGTPIPITWIQFGGRVVRLNMSNNLDTTSLYSLSVSGVRDATGNEIVVPQDVNVGVYETLVPMEGAWRFWYEPLYADLSAEWTKLDYDDSNWFGPHSSPLSNSNALHQMPGNNVLPVARTIYFRSTFVVPPDRVGFARLHLRHWLDDGATFYLNGEEVLFVNTPRGASYNDFINAARDPNMSPAGASDSVPFEGELLLKPGTNVLAAQLHQCMEENTSPSLPPGTPPARPDILFAAALEGWIQPELPKIRFQREGNEIVMSWTQSDVLLESAAQISGPWETVLENGDSYRERTTGPSRFYRLRRISR